MSDDDDAASEKGSVTPMISYHQTLMVPCRKRHFQSASPSRRRDSQLPMERGTRRTSRVSALQRRFVFSRSLESLECEHSRSLAQYM